MGLSSGTFTRNDGTRTGSGLYAQQKAASVNITASLLDTEQDEMATALSLALYRDGQATATADIPMGGFTLTNIATAGARNEPVQCGDLQDNQHVYAITGGSANAYTLTLAPAITALVDGMTFCFKASFSNTAACTIDVNSVGAKDIKLHGAIDPGANYIKSGYSYVIQYVATADDFYIVNPSTPFIATNDSYLTALDTAGTGVVELIKANASDQIQFGAKDVVPHTTELYDLGQAANVFANVYSQKLTVTDAGLDEWTFQEQSASTVELSVTSSGTRNLDMVNAGAGTFALKVNGTTVTVPFTATHRYMLGEPDLVEGEAVRLDAEGRLIRCVEAQDPLCAGLYTSELVKAVDYVEGHNDSFERLVHEDIHHVACLGDARSDHLSGARLSDENGQIMPGDYLTTARTPGYLMKQDSPAMCNYTVGQYRLPKPVKFEADGKAYDVYIYLLRG